MKVINKIELTEEEYKDMNLDPSKLVEVEFTFYIKDGQVSYNIFTTCKEKHEILDPIHKDDADVAFASIHGFGIDEYEEEIAYSAYRDKQMEDEYFNSRYDGCI